MGSLAGEHMRQNGGRLQDARAVTRCQKRSYTLLRAFEMLRALPGGYSSLPPSLPLYPILNSTLTAEWVHLETARLGLRLHEQQSGYNSRDQTGPEAVQGRRTLEMLREPAVAFGLQYYLYRKRKLF